MILSVNSKPPVLVTGGAGYIGSHTCLALIDSGFHPVVIDNLSKGHRDLVATTGATFIRGDIGDRDFLDRVFDQYEIAAVLHFAAHAYVGESVVEPLKYYRNNFCNTLTLLDAMHAAGIDQMVFSSSCATYGVPCDMPITEATEQHPINPYGRSKLFVERALRDQETAHGLRSVVLRYFNAAGADPAGRAGEDHFPETHLLPLALLAAAGQSKAFAVYGTDYATPDGSCVRDYVHVSDLASAHVAALEWLLSGKPSEAFNLGTGRGTSVLGVLAAVWRVTGQKVPVNLAPRRPGDPPALVANADKAAHTLGWRPERSEIDTVIADAWRWHSRRHLFQAAHAATSGDMRLRIEGAPG